MYSWLATPPAPGPSFEWLENGPNVVKDAVVQGMLLESTVPCEKSFSTLEPEAIRYAVAHGHPGIADVVNWDGVRTNTAEDETGTITAFTNKRVPFEYQPPLALQRGLQTGLGAMLVNDSHVFVLLLGNGKTDNRVLIFRKSDKTWHRLPSFGERQSRVRGFGRYLAVTEVGTNAQHPESAGIEKWKPGEIGDSLSLRSRVKELGQYYPGKLHITTWIPSKSIPSRRIKATAKFCLWRTESSTIAPLTNCIQRRSPVRAWAGHACWQQTMPFGTRTGPLSSTDQATRSNERPMRLHSMLRTWTAVISGTFFLTCMAFSQGGVRQDKAAKRRPRTVFFVHLFH